MTYTITDILSVLEKDEWINVYTEDYKDLLFFGKVTEVTEEILGREVKTLHACNDESIGIVVSSLKEM